MSSVPKLYFTLSFNGQNKFCLDVKTNIIIIKFQPRKQHLNASNPNVKITKCNNTCLRYEKYNITATRFELTADHSSLNKQL